MSATTDLAATKRGRIRRLVTLQRRELACLKPASVAWDVSPFHLQRVCLQTVTRPNERIILPEVW